LGCSASASGLKIEDLFQPADAGEIRSLLEKATRVGIAAKDLYLRLRDRNLYFAVTISRWTPAILPKGLMVLEDLTEVLKAQKANAWREVARRMAHEIKTC
jgi:nitrogen fixation/metabolism regulation signal transduction histidine kinase